MENEFTGFNCFMEESSEVGKAYIDMILQQEKASALDNKTRELAYIEYSCAMKSHFRKFGNQMSGSGNHLCNYASLLA